MPRCTGQTRSGQKCSRVIAKGARTCGVCLGPAVTTAAATGPTRHLTAVNDDPFGDDTSDDGDWHTCEGCQQPINADAGEVFYAQGQRSCNDCFMDLGGDEEMGLDPHIEGLIAEHSSDDPTDIVDDLTRDGLTPTQIDQAVTRWAEFRADGDEFPASGAGDETAEGIAWVHRGFTPGTAHMWSNEGFPTPNEAGRWNDAGFHRPREAAAWRECNVEPDWARRMADYGVEPDSYEPVRDDRWVAAGEYRLREEWEAAGVTSAHHARQFTRASFPPAEVGRWRDAGFEPQTDTIAIKEFRDAGWSPEKAASWTQRPDETLGLSFSSHNAFTFDAAGWAPRQAAAFYHGLEPGKRALWTQDPGTPQAPRIPTRTLSMASSA